MESNLRHRIPLGLLSLSLGVCGTFALPAHAQSGAELYQASCATCHGADGRGRSSAELGFDTPLPDFSDCDFANREPDADWGAIIHEGGPVRGFD